MILDVAVGALEVKRLEWALGGARARVARRRASVAAGRAHELEITSITRAGGASVAQRIEDNRAVATVDSVVQPTGGRWIPNFDSARVVNNPWGRLTFTFTDCNRSRVDFDSTVAGYGRGSMNLTRLTQLAGLACP